MKKSRIIRMLSEVIEDKQTGKQFWFDLDLYKHERDWPKTIKYERYLYKNGIKYNV